MRKKYRLYRYYDIAGNVLYIGYTSNPKQRHSIHKSQSKWIAEAVDCKIDDRFYLSKAKAQEAESAAINTENPRYNIQSLNPSKQIIEKLQIQADNLISLHGSIKAAKLLGLKNHSTVLRYRSGAIKTASAAIHKKLDKELA